MSDDRDLREAFARLRETDGMKVPRFEIPCARPRTRRSMVPAIAATLLLVALSLLYVSRRLPAPTPQIEIPTAMSTWRAPTDFLLKTPGCDLTSSVPRLQPRLPDISKGDRS